MLKINQTINLCHYEQQKISITYHAGSAHLLRGTGSAANLGKRDGRHRHVVLCNVLCNRDGDRPQEPYRVAHNDRHER